MQAQCSTSSRATVPYARAGCTTAGRPKHRLQSRAAVQQERAPAASATLHAGNGHAVAKGHAPPANGTALVSLEYVPAVPPVPLKYVVKDAVSRWFSDSYQDAMRGDVKQQALLGQMLAEGYGCDKDAQAAKEWSDRGWSRGYQMKGVYDEL